MLCPVNIKDIASRQGAAARAAQGTGTTRITFAAVESDPHGPVRHHRHDRTPLGVALGWSPQSQRERDDEHPAPRSTWPITTLLDDDVRAGDAARSQATCSHPLGDHCGAIQ
jgi:hypothetical protein